MKMVTVCNVTASAFADGTAGSIHFCHSVHVRLQYARPHVNDLYFLLLQNDYLLLSRLLRLLFLHTPY